MVICSVHNGNAVNVPAFVGGGWFSCSTAGSAALDHGHAATAGVTVRLVIGVVIVVVIDDGVVLILVLLVGGFGRLVACIIIVTVGDFYSDIRVNSNRFSFAILVGVFSVRVIFDTFRLFVEKRKL